MKYLDFMMIQQTIVDPVSKFTETFYGQVAAAVVSGIILGILGALVTRFVKHLRSKRDE